MQEKEIGVWKNLTKEEFKKNLDLIFKSLDKQGEPTVFYSSAEQVKIINNMFEKLINETKNENENK